MKLSLLAEMIDLEDRDTTLGHHISRTLVILHSAISNRRPLNQHLEFLTPLIEQIRLDKQSPPKDENWQRDKIATMSVNLENLAIATDQTVQFELLNKIWRSYNYSNDYRTI